MNKTVLLFLLLTYIQVISAIFPVFVFRAVSTVLSHIFGDDVRKAALKVQQSLDKTLGNDVSIGSVSAMDVEMVRVVEPYEKHAIVTDFIAGKAVHNMAYLEPLKRLPRKKEIVAKHPDVQVDLNEVIGIYIVLNESETAAAEVLLSVKPCLLSNSDSYFKQVSDPCKSLAKESISRMIERFEDIEKLRAAMEDILKVPVEWYNHWRRIYFKLNAYIEDLPLSKSEKASWEKINDFIAAKRVL